MKTLKFLMLAIVAVCIASCGGKKNTEETEEIVVKPAETEVSGDMTSSYEENESSSDSESYSSDDDDDSSISSDNDDDLYSSSSSSESEDWDDLLDSYEQYVDKYISYVKKAANGDMSALAEYPSLMEKAQEFSEKMEGAQGDMSTSQWTRYMNITNKMSKAALEMQ